MYLSGQTDITDAKHSPILYTQCIFITVCKCFREGGPKNVEDHRAIIKKWHMEEDKLLCVHMGYFNIASLLFYYCSFIILPFRLKKKSCIKKEIKISEEMWMFLSGCTGCWIHIEQYQELKEASTAEELIRTASHGV